MAKTVCFFVLGASFLIFLASDENEKLRRDVSEKEKRIEESAFHIVVACKQLRNHYS